MAENKAGSTRHCAYCLVEGQDLKTCAGCNKRAYCSKECQKQDWTEKGQTHKIWCKQECGEEDFDWRVQEVPGKGLGIVALRDFQPMSRIMVDRAYNWNELGTDPQSSNFLKFEPRDGTPFEKFALNGMGEENGGSMMEGQVAMRLVRVNHSCLANAIHTSEKKTKTKVLLAGRNIKVGEEVTICYTKFLDLNGNGATPEGERERLFRQYKIVCPSDCPCYDQSIWDAISQMETLYQNMVANADKLKSLAYRQVKELIALLNKYSNLLHPLVNCIALEDGFQLGIYSKKTFPEAVGYLRECLALKSKALHPEAPVVLRLKLFLEKPFTHPNFMAGEPNKKFKK